MRDFGPEMNSEFSGWPRHSAFAAKTVNNLPNAQLCIFSVFSKKMVKNTEKHCISCNQTHPK
jgi:hypothetical protein